MTDTTQCSVICRIKEMEGRERRQEEGELSKEKDRSWYLSRRSNVWVREWRVYVRMGTPHESQEETLSPH